MNKYCLLLVAAAISLVSGCGREEESDQFPTRTQVRLVLPEDEKEIIAGYLVRSADGTYDEAVIVEFRDGVTEKRIFRSDKTLQELQQLHPAVEGVGEDERQLKRTLLFDTDGKTVLFERVLRSNGTVEIIGGRRADGNFRREHFYDDGKQIHHVHVVSPKGLVLFDQEFRRNGLVNRVVRTNPRGDTIVEEYRDNGSIEYVIARSTSPYSPVEKTFYLPSGQVDMKVRYNANSIHVEYFEDGVVVEERDVYNTGTAHVEIFDENGNKIRRSYSGKPASDWTDISDLPLDSVTEYDGKSKVKRVIEFHDDQKTPKVVKLPDGQGTYTKTRYKYYRPDGTLEKEEYKVDYNTTRDKKEHTVEDNIREELRDEFFERSSRKSPELLEVMPLDPPGCEDCCGEGCENCWD